MSRPIRAIYKLNIFFLFQTQTFVKKNTKKQKNNQKQKHKKIIEKNKTTNKSTASCKNISNKINTATIAQSRMHRKICMQSRT